MREHYNQCIESAAAVNVGRQHCFPRCSALPQSSLGLYWWTGLPQCSVVTDSISIQQNTLRLPMTIQTLTRKIEQIKTKVDYYFALKNLFRKNQWGWFTATRL